MAAPATNIEFAKGGLRERIDAFFTHIFDAITSYSHHRSRADQVAEMNAKSDEDLAAMGLSRDDIPRYVFRDLFYI